MRGVGTHKGTIMRSFLVLFSAVFLALAHSDQEYSIPELDQKVDSYTKVKHAGDVCLFSGMVFTSAAIVFSVLAASSQYSASPSSVRTLATFGTLGFAVGIPLTGTGLVLTPFGYIKCYEYNRRLLRARRIEEEQQRNGVSIADTDRVYDEVPESIIVLKAGQRGKGFIYKEDSEHIVYCKAKGRPEISLAKSLIDFVVTGKDTTRYSPVK
jgi:hypothetical protein